jgi:DNA-binding CsgD family transcriptional regulator
LGRALAVAGPLPTRGKGMALSLAAALAFSAGDPSATARLGKEALAVWEVVGDARGRAAALHHLACVEEIHLNWEAAGPLFEAELALWRELDEPGAVATTQMLLSGVAFGQGDLGRAVALAEEAAAGFRELGDRGWLASVEWYLGLFAAAKGQLADAARRYRDSLNGYAEVGEVSFLFKPLVGLAAVAIEVGLPDTAAKLLGAADELTARTGAALFPFDLPAYERAQAGSLKLLGETAFAARHRTGSTLGVAELLAEADAVVATAEATPSLPPRSGRRAPTDLSPRELDVLRLVAEGKTDAAIAGTMFLSRRTVNAHVANILGKLGAPTRGDAVARARDLGLLDGVPGSTRYT